MNSTCTVAEGMTPEDNALLSAFIINVVLFVVFMLGFEFVRGRYAEYTVRCTDRDILLVNEDEEEGGGGASVVATSPLPYSRRYVADQAARVAKKPPTGLLGWLRPTLAFSDDELLKIRGLDAVAFLLIVRAALRCAVVMLATGIILAIVYGTESRDDWPADQRGECDSLVTRGLATISVANVAAGASSARLWATLIVLAVNAFVCMRILSATYAAAVRAKIASIKVAGGAAPPPEARAVVVSDALNTSDADDVARIVNASLGGHVIGAQPTYVTAKAQKLLDERYKLLLKLDHAIGARHASKDPSARPMMRKKPVIGAKVDALAHLQAELVRVEAAYEAERARAARTPAPGYFFVFFDSVLAATRALSVNMLPWRVAPAPPPSSVNWDGFGVSSRMRSVRVMLVVAALFALCVFWTIPVAFVASISNLEQLARVPGLDFLVGLVEANAAVKGFVQGFLPTLALIIFMALLVTIIRALIGQMKLVSRAAANDWTLAAYYAFLVINVLFIYAAAGSVFASLQDVAEDPASLPALLGNSLPKQSSFFIAYVLLRIAAFAMALFRPVPLIVAAIKRRFLAKTPRETTATYSGGAFDYDVAAAQHLLIFTIVACYATLAPFIMLFGIAYFAMAATSFRHNIVYVHRATTDAKGASFNTMFLRLVGALLLQQILAIGVLSLKSFPYSALSVLVLIYTLVHARSIVGTYRERYELGSLLDYAAVEVENESGGGVSGGGDVSAMWQAYRAPATVPVAEHPDELELKDADVDRVTVAEKAVVVVSSSSGGDGSGGIVGSQKKKKARRRSSK